MQDWWKEHRILILGMTYPNYSKKYRENVCTGGLLEGDARMVRLHPIPQRYHEEGQKLKSFQWIKAEITKHSVDPRPESYRIKPETIALQEEVSSKDHETRRRWIEKSPHLFQSVEVLKDHYDSNKTSLGIVKPAEVTDCTIEMRTEEERREWEKRGREALRQEDMFRDVQKPLDFPEAKFFVHWRCDDSRCTGHKMAINQWGIHELYRKLKADPARDVKTIKTMWSRLNIKEKDIFLFLGSFRGKMFNFGLMDSYSAPKKSQLSLGI